MRQTYSKSFNQDGGTNETNSEYDEQGNRILYTSVNKGPTGIETSKSINRYGYDTNGNQTSRQYDSYLNGELIYSTSSSLINGQMRDTYRLSTYTDGSGLTRKDESNYTYKDDGSSSEVNKSYVGNTPTYDATLTYDTNHNTLSVVETYYDDAGTVTGYSNSTYEYNADGCQSKIIRESYNTDHFLTNIQYEIPFENTYLTTQSKSFDPDGSKRESTFEYDEKGRQVYFAEDEYNSDGVLTSIHYSSKFPGQNQINYNKYFSQDGSAYESIQECDAYGNQVGSKDSSYNADGVLIGSYSMSYNPDGSTTETSYNYDEYGTYQGKTVRTCANGEYNTIEYDANGNQKVSSIDVNDATGWVY
jgi:hypothetical protein